VYSSTEIATFEHDMEYEADLYAVRHVAHRSQVRDRLAHAGVAVLLFLAFVEECSSRHGLNRLRIQTTHPKSLDRAWRLWRSVDGESGVGKKEMNERIATGARLSKLLDDMIVTVRFRPHGRRRAVHP
jgi:hypothetical protein